MTRNARIALVLAAVAVAVAAFLAIGTGGDDEDGDGTVATAPAPTSSMPTTTPGPDPVPVWRLRDGAPVGGSQRLEVRSGERARFVIASDTEQEVHVHGYDITRTVPAGGRTTFSFRADDQGVYEVEAHGTGEEIAQLRVVP